MTVQEQVQPPFRQHQTRRRFFRDCGISLGGFALGGLLPQVEAARMLTEKVPHFAAKARRVIFLFQAGAPSHLDLFDYKPLLQKFNGTLPLAELLKDCRATLISPNSTLLASKFKFARHGQCGAELSELLPHLAGIVDDITIVRSMQTDAVNHAPAQIFMNTGSQQFGRPGIGAWATYGLGTENRNLPAYAVLSTGQKGISGGSANWGSGFLPTACHGVPFRGQGAPNIAARIDSRELACRMQTSAPEVMDLSRESKETVELYGAEPGKPSYANSCLLARRMVERGVRFVQVFHGGWDHHGGLARGLQEQCGETDRASAALVKDLKQRGLLDDTLVIWGGEFGRSPMAQGGNDGRDHHPRAFTMWFAGGGVKRGFSVGRTDDFGFDAVQDPVHVHDLHATILHLLGFDHKRFTFRSQGRDFRLTDMHGEVVKQMLA